MLTDFTKQERKDIFAYVGASMHIRAEAVEKDWWVTQVLKALFLSEYSKNIVFKGGTSLSKGWNTIERFSEDVDIAIDREFLGFPGVLTKTQISDKLRRASCSFVRTNLKESVEKGLSDAGIPHGLFSVNVDVTPVTTTDPEKLYVYFESVFDDVISEYVKPRVIIEAGARSMTEPSVPRVISSFVSAIVQNKRVVDGGFSVRTTPAQRTFLEKVFLLHEEFHKGGSIRTDRMSRHLYDLEKMMDTEIGQAINDKELYMSIVEHRRRFIGLKGFDYNTLMPESIDIIPPESVIGDWKKDYTAMQESMIFGDSLPFEELIARLRVLNERINSLSY